MPFSFVCSRCGFAAFEQESQIAICQNCVRNVLSPSEVLTYHSEVMEWSRIKGKNGYYAAIFGMIFAISTGLCGGFSIARNAQENLDEAEAQRIRNVAASACEAQKETLICGMAECPVGQKASWVNGACECSGPAKIRPTGESIP